MHNGFQSDWSKFSTLLIDELIKAEDDDWMYEELYRSYCANAMRGASVQYVLDVAGVDSGLGLAEKLREPGKLRELPVKSL